MAYKIDVSEIVKDHLKTLVNAKTGRPDFRDIFFFLLAPCLVTALLIFNCVALTSDFVNALIGGLSIYVGLSLNFIALVFDLASKKTFKTKERKDLIRETVANISVSIFYSIFIIVFSLLANVSFIKVYATASCYFIIMQFLLTLLMILKRIYKLLTEQLDSSEDD